MRPEPNGPLEIASRTTSMRGRALRTFALSIIGVLLWSGPARAQQSEIPAKADAGPACEPDQPTGDLIITMFPHSKTSRYWISGQDNIIFQYHPSFYAKYNGPNSFTPGSNNATSNVSTLFLGYQLRNTTEVYLDVEEASGGGLSDGLGLAGFVNLDVVRNPLLSKAPYIARVLIRQIIPLSKDMVEAERGPFELATDLPARRLELRAGKFGMADFFDTNAVGSDSHFQFMNWTVDNNGAYDYAADTRGYTYGVIVAYDDRNWGFQFAEALMPKVANGIDLVWNLHQARAENYELALYPKLWKERNTAVRFLSFVKHANMGVYRDAVKNFLDEKTPVPDITAHPQQSTVKYGFGVNLQQDAPLAPPALQEVECVLAHDVLRYRAAPILLAPGRCQSATDTTLTSACRGRRRLHRGTPPAAARTRL